MFTAKANFCKDFKDIKSYDPPLDNEVNENDPYVEYQSLSLGKASQSSSPKSSRSGSPSEQYSTAKDQMETLDDEVEFKLFAQALTNRCRSIDDSMLGELRPEDFRKALRLYNAMKCLTNGNVSEAQGNKFDPKVYEQVCKLRTEISGMVSIDEDPGPAMAHLFKWIQHAPPRFDQWLNWVEKNGSRGMGSELAHTREVSGVLSRFFVPMDDRDASVANVFGLKAKSDSPKDVLLFEVQQYVGSIMHLMGEGTYQDKAKIGMQIIEILEDGQPLSSLEALLVGSQLWRQPESPDAKGDLLSLKKRTESVMKPPDSKQVFSL